MRHLTLICFLLTTTIISGQDTLWKAPEITWSIGNKKFNGEYVEFTMATIIPKDWMIVTETDSSILKIPLHIYLTPEDSLLMKRVEIIQTKGEKTFNSSLQKVFSSKVETTRDSIAYRVRIYLKNKRKPDKITGAIAYWLLSEEIAMPPQDQNFILRFF